MNNKVQMYMNQILLSTCTRIYISFDKTTSKQLFTTWSTKPRTC